MRARAPREAAVRTHGGHGGCVVGVVGVIAVAAAAAGITAGVVVGIVIIAALCGGLSLGGADGRAAQRLRQSFLLLKGSAGNSLDVRAPQVGNGLCAPRTTKWQSISLEASKGKALGVKQALMFGMATKCKDIVAAARLEGEVVDLGEGL